MYSLFTNIFTAITYNSTVACRSQIVKFVIFNLACCHIT